MQKLSILLLTASVCYGFFPELFSNQKNDAYNLCVYSSDPSKYEPKCFTCALAVYQNAMNACVNGSTSMPSNITYAAANCMEKNCAINYPKPATSPPLDLKVFEKIFHSLTNQRKRRSIEDNKIHDSSVQSSDELGLDPSEITIIGQVETFASGSDIPEVDLSEFEKALQNNNDTSEY